MFMLICLASQKKYIFQNQNSQLLLQFKRFSPAAVFFFFFFFIFFFGPPATARRVCPSVLPSVRKFFWDWLISFFSETQHSVRGPYLVECGRAGFFGKIPQWAKITKNGQKCPKNMVFELFKNITTLVLSGVCVK